MENIKLEMRKLSGQDLFPMMKILAKVKVKDMILDFIKKRAEVARKSQEAIAMEGTKEYTEEEKMEIGMELFADILNTTMCNLDLAKEDINLLLSSVCNAEVKEIRELDMLQYTSLLMDFFSKEELVDFFKCIASSNVFQSLR
ncbi:hypothetical protein JHL18_02055 [Clostridium sp. YIM B02505]|uniref:Uncharacterized protein n=1 Tax=Clostridium yunnanense TaxID=2800325 RepID=A0ABS1EJ99_9CLOT|nr:hypothetical protein [Clostridium yunnanense]MBK1809431.1 hypothetical protein [Clostridium yunnanense]